MILKSEKRKFRHRKNLILLEYADIVYMQVSCILSCFFVVKINKYFIGYKGDDYKIKPSRIMLPKTSAYIRSYGGETKWMNFLIKDDNLLKKYIDI